MFRPEQLVSLNEKKIKIMPMPRQIILYKSKSFF